MSRKGRNSSRAYQRRRRYGQATWDGVSDEEIFSRDEWQCQMPVCLCSSGRRIDQALQGPGNDPWRPSIDHIVLLADGGPDAAENKRAAHAYCNTAAAPSRRLRSERLSPLDLSVAARLPDAVLNQLSQWGL